LLGALAAALVLAAAAAAAPAQENVKIESISFEGNNRYSTENLKYSMRTKEGRVLDRELLARDEAALYIYFETVSLREEAVPGGVRLTFTVVENPVVSRVDFVGVRNLKEDDLRTLLDTRTGYPLAVFRLENDVNRIARRFRDEGYHWIDVKAETPDDEGAKRVIFRVVEGPRVRVNEIVFKGNPTIPEGKLRAVMALRPGWLLSPTDFVEGRLDEDSVALSRYYHDQGFLDARVWIRPVVFNADRDLATITVVVEEGEPWTVGEVQVSGGAALADRAKVVATADRLKPGQRWLRKDVDRVARDMEAEAKRQGYSDAHVEVEPAPRAEGLVQDVRFAIDEGRKYTIRFLDVSGNVVTRDKVIIREFSVGPGDPLDSAAVAKSIRRVLDTQYFSSAVSVVKDVPDDPERKDVEIKVEEGARTNLAQFSVAVSSDRGLSATIALTMRNFDVEDVPIPPSRFLEGRGFKGAGQTLGVTLSPGTIYSNYDLNFFEPWFLDRRVGVGGDLYIWRSTRFDYDENHKGVSLRAVKTWLLPGEDLDDFLSVELDPRVESVQMSHIDVHAPPNAFALEGVNAVHSLALRSFWRRTDQEHAAERGWSGSFNSEYGGGYLGGDFDYWKNDAELTRVFTLWKDADERAYTLKLRGAFGVGMATGDGKVPLVERYFAGGSSGIGAVRGYSYYGLGPHGQGDPSKGPFKVFRSIDNNFGQPMGGDAVSSGTIEFDYPLVSDVLGGAFFLDAGNCGFSTGDLKRDWRAAWGFGILIRIPFFGRVPLRFDFGFPFKTVSGDKRQMLSFGLNFFF
jgi:outer membrane protein insertion porin family